jgi:spermidine/putrescine transport system ATP-binding protein
VSKRYGDFTAVAEIDLDIPGGSYYCLLGPSGSGKSTILRLIAGLETLSEGRVLIGEADVSTVAANRRPVHTVFQSYALFPRMTVFDNVAYGLRARRAGSRSDIAARVSEALAQVRLAGSEDRKPAQLSGGMQQRVALARALVNRPEVLLLDEPLGALDLKLRREMQDELVRLQRESETTFVHVTHDQEECFACATEVAVMRLGAIEQVGAPREIYRRPATEFAASFLGSANIVAATVVSGSAGDGYHVRWDGGELHVGGPAELPAGRRAALVIRPEELEVRAADAERAGGGIDGRVIDVLEAASTVRLRVAVLGSELLVERSAAAPGAGATPGDRVEIRVCAGCGWLVDDAPERAGIVAPRVAEASVGEPAGSGEAPGGAGAGWAG